MGVIAFSDNPYDGHTLNQCIDQINRLTKKPEDIFVDRGYRGHNYAGSTSIHVDKVKRGKTSKNLWG